MKPPAKKAGKKRWVLGESGNRFQVLQVIRFPTASDYSRMAIQLKEGKRYRIVVEEEP